MKITQYAVKNYQFTLIIFIMIIVLGLTTLLNMSRSEDPEMHAPTFTVVVVYPGTSPGDMEELVVKPLEKEIWGLENIKRIRTTIGDGVAAIRVEYKYNSNVDNKYQEIVRVVNSKRPELPADIASIDVQKFQPSDVNIIQVALVSENASREKMKYLCRKTAGRTGETARIKKSGNTWHTGSAGESGTGSGKNVPDAPATQCGNRKPPE